MLEGRQSSLSGRVSSFRARQGAKKDHPQPKCWYEPARYPDEATLGLRWTLSQPVTAAIPPGDERYFRLAMELAQRFEPVTNQEQKELMAGAGGVNPIFHLGTV